MTPTFHGWLNIRRFIDKGLHHCNSNTEGKGKTCTVCHNKYAMPHSLRQVIFKPNMVWKKEPDDTRCRNRGSVGQEVLNFSYSAQQLYNCLVAIGLSNASDRDPVLAIFRLCQEAYHK